MGVYFLSSNETNLVLSLKYGRDWIFPSILQGLSITLIVLYFTSLLLWKLKILLFWKLLLEKMRQLFRKVKLRSNSSENNQEGDSMIDSSINNRDLLDVTTEKATY